MIRRIGYLACLAALAGCANQPLQTRQEKVVLAPLDNPVFRELWAPVEGRVVNLSLTWRI